MMTLEYRFSIRLIHSFYNKIQFKRFFNDLFSRKIQFKNLFQKNYFSLIQFNEIFIQIENQGIAHHYSVGIVFNEASSAIESVHIVVLSGLLMTSFLPGCDTITDSLGHRHCTKLRAKEKNTKAIYFVLPREDFHDGISVYSVFII